MTADEDFIRMLAGDKYRGSFKPCPKCNGPWKTQYGKDPRVEASGYWTHGHPCVTGGTHYEGVEWADERQDCSRICQNGHGRKRFHNSPSRTQGAECTHARNCPNHEPCE